MGYESKLYIVEEADFKIPSDNGKVWAEVIGMVDLCVCYSITDVFTNIANGYIYDTDGNTRIEEESYGKPLRVANLEDVIEEESIDPIENIYSKVITEDMIKYINTKLSLRDRRIINMRYGLNGEEEKTQQEIADMLNISRSYVSRIETKVAKRLNKFILEEK